MPRRTTVDPTFDDLGRRECVWLKCKCGCEVCVHPGSLLDVDAPESRQTCRRFEGTVDLYAAEWRCGQQASLALSDWIGARTVTCETAGKDKYKRWLERCSVGGADLAEWMADHGWVVPYRDCKSEVVRAAANAAKSSGAGIWAGTFMMPWDWRAQQATAQQTAEQPTVVRPSASQDAASCLI